MENSILVTDEKIIQKIYSIRGLKVMLNRDLAELFGTNYKSHSTFVQLNVTKR